MRIKRLVFFGLGVLAISGFWVAKIVWDNSAKPKKPPETLPYCVPASSVVLSSSKIPRLKIEIGDHELEAELDLGLAAYASATKGMLDKISEKSFIGTTLMHGWNGKQRQKNVYEISKITIGQISFHDLQLQESSYEFENDTILIETQRPETLENIRLGWHLFRKTALFLDLGNTKILFCDSAATLARQGYELKKFAKTPLLLNRGCMDIEVITPDGPLVCELDTGATLNIRHRDNSEGKSMEQLILDPENTEKFTSFQIGGVNLGPVAFHLLPTTFQSKIESVLGMEFFLTHQVFIDFIEKQVYFAPIMPPPTPTRIPS